MPFLSRGEPWGSRRFAEAELTARLNGLTKRDGAAKFLSLVISQPSQAGMSRNHS